MGNWRRVQIVGRCAAKDVPALRVAVTDKDHYEHNEYHPLIGGGGMAGLPVWAAESINAVGNLAERDYSVEFVAETLERLSKIAPSLTVKIHCGGDYEDSKCIATITLENGVAVIGAPEINVIPEVSEAQMQVNIMQALMRARERRF